MPAGLFLTGQIIRFSNSSDDEVGGSVPTGTAVYTNVRARIEAVEPTMALLEQGIETPTMVNAILYPATMTIKHNDQLYITGPALSPYYGEKFRIVGIQHSSMIDQRGFIVVTARRLEEAHSNALQ